MVGAFVLPALVEEFVKLIPSLKLEHGFKL
jgi:hypothetical protein